MIALWSLLWCAYATFYLHEVTCAQNGEIVLQIDEDTRRPIWNVAHMVNALYQVDYYLDQGANSLEFDISFTWEGVAQYTFHGVPCDCFRSCTRYESFNIYLEYLRILTSPGTPQYREELALLFMDCKVHGLSPEARIRAGEDLAMKIIDLYWQKGKSGARAYILISVPSIENMDFVNSLRRTFKEQNYSHYDNKIGFDFSGNENLESIKQAFEGQNIFSNIWQGDGITNCLPRGTGRLKEALWRRDQPGSTYINKVYWWTVDKMSTMRTVLKMSVDGMITNYPDRLISVLNEDEFSSKFKLATYEDSPWITHSHEKTASLVMPEGRSGNFTVEDFMSSDEDELLYNC